MPSPRNPHGALNFDPAPDEALRRAKLHDALDAEKTKLLRSFDFIRDLPLHDLIAISPGLEARYEAILAARRLERELIALSPIDGEQFS